MPSYISTILTVSPINKISRCKNKLIIHFFSLLLKNIPVFRYEFSLVRRYIEFIKNSINWTCSHTIATIYTNRWVYIILFFFFSRMNAIYRTNISTSGVFITNTWFCNYVYNNYTPIFSRRSMSSKISRDSSTT